VGAPSHCCSMHPATWAMTRMAGPSTGQQ
jgi:hypothetical protein